MGAIKTIAISTAVAVALNAQNLELKDGWNLVGVQNNTTVEALKKESNVTKVFLYSGDSWIESGNIKPSQGIWIKTNGKITLNITQDDQKLENSDKLQLKAGWNLLSLPIDSAITPRVFKNNLLWKYKDGIWSRYYDKNQIDSYPKIDIIASGEGFWVYSEEAKEISLSEEEGKLESFTTAQEMTDYIESVVKFNKSYRSKNNYYPIMYVTTGAEGAFPPPTATADTSSGGNKVTDATTTNLQESGVDESDIIKHDGVNLFYLSSDYSKNEILINSFENLLSGGIKEIGSIKLESKPSELYLIDNKLIAIYPYNTNFWDLWTKVDFGIWSEKSKIEVYDVKDIKNVSLVQKYEIDGNIVDTRITGGKLYTATRFMPYIEVEYPKVYVDCNESSGGGGYVGVEVSKPVIKSIMPYPYYDNGCYFYQKDEKGYFRLDYDNPIYKGKYLEPRIKNRDKNESLITSSTLFAPSKANQSPFITTISGFDLSNFERESISVVGDSSTLYASNKAIYLVSERYPIYYNFRDYKMRSMIYKFSIDGGLKYSGGGFVDGRILNQFSLSEHNDILRVATTTGWSWTNDTNNILTTLQAKDNELKTVGSLSGLGKAGEVIRGVRFLGDKGFIVTFKQTDPLYTIDLTDPSSPKKVGELSINGYSTYFHPINENIIMSVGRDANSSGTEKGIQLQLFDISNFANPILTDKVIIGDNSSYGSEALYNHKAFAFRDSDKMFALPISYYKYETISTTTETSGYRDYYKNYLDIYKIENNKIVSKASIDSNSSSYQYGSQRGVIFSKDSKNYGIYMIGDKMLLGEIKN